MDFWKRFDPLNDFSVRRSPYNLKYNPSRIKGRAIFRSRPSTKKVFVSPVLFFGQKCVARPVFPLYFSLKIIASPKKQQKIFARPFSPLRAKSSFLG